VAGFSDAAPACHDRFDRPFVTDVGPASLKQLSFRTKVNQTLDGVAWPASPRSFPLEINSTSPSLGRASVQQLPLGREFNQPTSRVVRPTYLLHHVRSWLAPSRTKGNAFGVEDGPAAVAVGPSNRYLYFDRVNLQERSPANHAVQEYVNRISMPEPVSVSREYPVSVGSERASGNSFEILLFWRSKGA